MKIVLPKMGFVGRKKAVGRTGVRGGRNKKCQEKRDSYLLLNVESHIRMCHEPVPEIKMQIGGV